MDPLIVSGVLIVGIGIGLTQQRPSSKTEPGPVTCHCECSGDKQPPVQSGSTFREIGLALLAGLLLGALLILTLKHFVESQKTVNSPVKGKGKKGGVFGSPLALTFTE